MVKNHRFPQNAVKIRLIVRNSNENSMERCFTFFEVHQFICEFDNLLQISFQLKTRLDCITRIFPRLSKWSLENNCTHALCWRLVTVLRVSFSPCFASSCLTFLSCCLLNESFSFSSSTVSSPCCIENC